MTAYLLGNIIFIIFWLIIFIIRPKTRNLQIFGSLLLLPFAVLDIWFRPEYWQPPLLIKSIEPLSLETVIYCFTAGGIAMAFGSFFQKSKISWRKLDWRKIFIFFIISFGIYDIFRIIFNYPAMNDLNFSFLIIFITLLVKDWKENIKSLIPAIIFSVFTIAAINIALIFFPNFVSEYWNLPKLWPLFLNTPTEEIFFVGVLASLWTLLPQYLIKKND
jgi:hypothetical protein